MSLAMSTRPVPGYTGALKPEARSVMPLKTAVSQRVPLDKRASQSVLSDSTHISGTEGAAPAASDSFTRSYFLPKRHLGHTTYSEASQSYVRSAKDVPPRVTDHGASATSAAVHTAAVAPKFESMTTKTEATQGYSVPEDTSFYSRVRQIERQDDDARHSLEDPKTRSGAAKNLRCSAIQRKREHDPAFAPQGMKFKPVPRVRPNVTVSAHGTQPARSHSAAPAAASGGTGKHGAPISLSGSSVGHAHFTAAGTTQSLDFPDPRSKATEATKVLGTKQSEKPHLAPDRALVESATSRDLLAGTAKSAEGVASGYMGHVPANPENVARMRGAADKLRAHMKTVDTVTAPTSNSTTSLLRQKLAAARAAAEQSRGRPMTPKTSSAFYATQAAHSADERKINRVEVGRKNAVRGFFTRGEGEQDDLVADQFCLRYRPLEGAMRHGPPKDQTWISETELRRAPRL